MNKKTLMYAGIAVAVVVIIVILLRMRNKPSNKSQSYDYVIEEKAGLATYDELLGLGYSEDEAKQIINSESYKQGIKNY